MTTNPSTARAVLLGHLVVTLPAAVVVAVVAFLAVHPFDVGWRLGVIIGTALAWMWWSLAVPRWRRWALRQGVDPNQLQRLAQRTGLVWRKGSVMERTEIHR